MISILDVVGGDVGSLVVASGVILRLFSATSEEQKPQFAVERQVDPGVHDAVECEQPEQPDYRVGWKIEQPDYRVGWKIELKVYRIGWKIELKDYRIGWK